jgi:hypothetical protein
MTNQRNMQKGAAGVGGGYRYFKINVTAIQGTPSSDSCIAMNIEWRVATAEQLPTMTSNTAPSPYVISTNTSETDAYLCYDDNAGTYGKIDSPYTSPAWIKVDVGAGNEFTPDSITYRAHAGGPQHSPKDFTIEASNDDSAWDVLDTQTGVTWDADETKTFSF